MHFPELRLLPRTLCSGGSASSELMIWQCKMSKRCHHLSRLDIFLLKDWPRFSGEFGTKRTLEIRINHKNQRGVWFTHDGGPVDRDGLGRNPGTWRRSLRLEVSPTDNYNGYKYGHRGQPFKICPQSNLHARLRMIWHHEASSVALPSANYRRVKAAKSIPRGSNRRPQLLDGRHFEVRC